MFNCGGPIVKLNSYRSWSRVLVKAKLTWGLPCWSPGVVNLSSESRP